METIARTANSTFAVGGISCSASTFVLKIPPIANLQTVALHCRKPTTHSSTFGFCRHAKPKQKPKELEFLPTLEMN